jgi:hypothetical protein
MTGINCLAKPVLGVIVLSMLISSPQKAIQSLPALLSIIGNSRLLLPC